MTRHNAQSGDREAIIAIIEAETEAWLRSDTSGWADCWVQAPHAQHIIARPSVGARVLYGFDEIAAYFTPLIEAFSSQSERPRDVRRENWRISIRGDMAWATFEQYIPLDAGEDGAPGRHNQMRILERVDGAWKIAAIFQIPNRIGYYAGPWVRVDRAAHILDIGLGTAEALRTHPALRKVGQKLCTRHTADAEILRAALTEADELISVHRGKPPRPLILNHEHGTGISLAWVSNSDMMIVVLLGDESLLSNTIAHAGRVFGLSRMQVRVATALARGNDSSTIARDLGVQPNTVRTHVRRMFERLEVTSQIALVRTLMSLDPPTH